MADYTLTPGARRANISCRQLLSAASAAPVIACREAPDWPAVFAAYVTARHDAEAFFQANLRGYKGPLTPAYHVLEARLDALHDICDDRLTMLVTTQAPDGPAFLRKFAICYRDIFAPDADRPDAAAHLLIDAQRLPRA